MWLKCNPNAFKYYLYSKNVTQLNMNNFVFLEKPNLININK